MASSQRHRARPAGKAGTINGVAVVDEEAMHGRRSRRRAPLGATPHNPTNPTNRINRQARAARTANVKFGRATTGSGSGGEL